MSSIFDQRYRTLRYSTDGHDCAIRALCAATGGEYADVMALAVREGFYRPGQGMQLLHLVHMIELTGHRMQITSDLTGLSLAEVSKELRRMAPPGGIIALTCDHAVGYYNGVCYDHAENDATMVVRWLWRIVKCRG